MSQALSQRTIVAILAGGSGTRLWPLSRGGRPKHLLNLTGEGELLRLTYERVAPLADRVLVISAGEQADLIREVLPQVEESDIIREPAARGTAAAIALAAVAASALDPGAVLATVPADHYVPAEMVEAWRADYGRAIAAARESQALATVGIVPSYPSTGYGYIELSQERGPQDSRRARRFVEKPDLEHAQAYLDAGNYVWNSSYFCFAPGALEREMGQHAPAYLEAARRTLATGAASAEAYLELKSDTIDYTVMEKTSRLLVISSPVVFGDIGSWADLHGVLARDEGENAFRGAVTAIDCEGSVIMSSGRRVAALGLRDMVVVDTADALLILPRSRAQDVKKLVEKLRESGEEGLL